MFVVTKHHICIIIVTLIVLDSCMSVPCTVGEYLHTPGEGDEVCVRCKAGTYMPQKQHTHRQCFKCSQVVEPDLEIMVSICNVFQDAVILCKERYFRERAATDSGEAHDDDDDNKDKCVKCSECDNPVKLCQNYSDTVCCDIDEDAVLEDGEYICKTKPFLCKSGHFYNINTGHCLPCPPHTYMPIDRHNNEQCIQCLTLSTNRSSHAKIFQNCTAVSPTLFGCEDGFFRHSSQKSLVFEEDCMRCQTCLHEEQACYQFQDAVCCPIFESALNTTSKKCASYHMDQATTWYFTDRISYYVYGFIAAIILAGCLHMKRRLYTILRIIIHMTRLGIIYFQYYMGVIITRCRARRGTSNYFSGKISMKEQGSEEALIA